MKTFDNRVNNQFRLLLFIHAIQYRHENDVLFSNDTGLITE